MLPLLEIKNLQIDFRTEKDITTAVADVSFQVKRGELVAIVGESGSGKSVTALSILQLLSEKSASYPKGDILFSPDGHQTTNLLRTPLSLIRHIRGHKIAMIFQEPMTSLNPVFTCGNQVSESLKEHKKMGSGEAKLATIQLFEQVKLPRPSEIFDRYPHQLSGGQKQRVMIALAMSCQPDLLICDEPTTALDVTVQKTILTLIRDLQLSNNMGVIFITHDLGVVSEIADRAVVMYKGRIVEQATIKDLFNNPAHAYTKALIACRPSLYPKGTRLPVVADFLGEPKTIVTQPLKETPPSTDILIQTKDLSVWYPSERSLLGKVSQYTKAVESINLEIYKGETLGLVGESGCGKTTLGRCLLRLIEPSNGQIQYNGQDLTKMSRNDLRSLRKEIQIVFQDPYSSLNPSLTIEQALTEPLAVHGMIKNSKGRRDRVVELLEKVDLSSSHLNRYPHEFSGGQRQRIVIARALTVNPSFVVCDESVSALDVSVQAQVLNMLSDLKKELGFTILFISHDLSVVHFISDRIAVMQQGKIVEIGEAGKVFKNPSSDYTSQLIASIPGIQHQSR